MEIRILGAGVSGLSTAYHLEKFKVEYELFEKEPQIGGLCKTFRFKGFVFDRALHVIHMKKQNVYELVMDLLGKDLISHRRRTLVFYNGKFIPYPFQVFFPSLPNSKVVKECFNGLRRINRSRSNQSAISNFEEWCYQNFGKGITQYFMRPYNEKLYKKPLNELSWGWAERFVPKVDVNDLFVKGNVDCATCKKYGYNVNFWYPKEGINALPQAFFTNIDKRKVYLNTEVKRISLSQKTIELSDGTVNKWDVLISSIPLPNLVSLIVDVPIPLKQLSKKFRWVSIYNLNIGVSGNSPTDAHWIYFSDKEYSFYRIGFPSSLTPYMSPKGTYSLSLEASFLPGFVPNFEKWKSQITKDLLRIKFLPSLGDVCITKELIIPYGYVIPDLNYKNCREIVLSFLSKHGILNIGRYGLWEYSSMQDAILEGEMAAKSVQKLLLRQNSL